LTVVFQVTVTAKLRRTYCHLELTCLFSDGKCQNEILIRLTYRLLVMHNLLTLIVLRLYIDITLPVLLKNSSLK